MVQILTWFLDSPESTSPYSLHRIASEGCKLDKAIGEWFGPSTIASVLRYADERPNDCPIYVGGSSPLERPQPLRYMTGRS